MITFKEVYKNYPPNHPALTDLSFHINKGEMVFIKGPSGAGKSTLLNLIAGIESVSHGQIIVEGLNIHRLSGKQLSLHRRRLGMIFQKPLLLNSRSVYDNVAISLIIGGFHGREIPTRVHAALDKVGLLHKTQVLPMNLSGGEQQRLGIARAIVHKPNILLADEPTGNLDTDLSQEIMTLFSRFHQSGMTVVIATHDQTLLENKLNAYTSRHIDLKQGHLSCLTS